MNSYDLLPSFVELFGFQFQDKNVDAISLIPVLCGRSFARETLFWNYPYNQKDLGMKPASAIRKENHKLAERYEAFLLTDGQGFELYNVEKDIGE